MHTIKLYGLSTCIHCKNAIAYLDEKGLTYDKTFVDLLNGDDYDRMVEEVRKLNPNLSFPTILIDDKEVVVGFHNNKLDELLK